MPTVLVDRSMRKQCDKLFTTDTLIQYGLLVGSTSSVEGNSVAKEDALYVVGAVPVALDEEATPSVPTNKLVSMTEKYGAVVRRCTGYRYFRVCEGDKPRLGPVVGS